MLANTPATVIERGVVLMEKEGRQGREGGERDHGFVALVFPLVDP